MATYAGTSDATTVGVSSTSSVAKEAMTAVTTGTGANAAVAVYASSAGGAGLEATTGASNSSAIYGHCSNGGVAVNALSNTTTASYGALVASNNGGGNAIYATSLSSGGYALYALAAYVGVYSYANSVSVFGLVDVSNAKAVWGYCNTTSSTSYAVYGNAAGSAYAGCFVGNCYLGGGSSTTTIQGSLTKPGGSFLIDHPLDPSNRYLLHSFVESPDMKNIYDGVATADDSGEAVVQMPPYFDALNESFRYCLTPIGASAPDLHVKSELEGGRFIIAGARPGQRVSWQVTGIRKDAWAKANRIPVEKDKPADERGLFLYPELYNEPESKGVHFKHRSAAPPAAATPSQGAPTP